MLDDLSFRDTGEFGSIDDTATNKGKELFLEQSPQRREDFPQRFSVRLLNCICYPTFHLTFADRLRPKKYWLGIKIGPGRQAPILSHLPHLLFSRSLRA